MTREPRHQQIREEELVEQVLASAPDGRDLAGRTWSRVRFDIVLAPKSR